MGILMRPTCPVSKWICRKWASRRHVNKEEAMPNQGNLSHLKKYASRNSPPYSAAAYPKQAMYGNDGLLYESRRAGGSHRWFKVDLQKAYQKELFTRSKSRKQKFTKSRKQKYSRRRPVSRTVINPKTGRRVKRDGAIGRRIISSRKTIQRVRRRKKLGKR